MKVIDKIIIKCSSGYGCLEEAFSDCIIVERNKISYSYKPVMPS